MWYAIPGDFFPTAAAAGVRIYYVCREYVPGGMAGCDSSALRRLDGDARVAFARLRKTAGAAMRHRAAVQAAAAAPGGRTGTRTCVWLCVPEAVPLCQNGRVAHVSVRAGTRRVAVKKEWSLWRGHARRKRKGPQVRSVSHRSNGSLSGCGVRHSPQVASLWGALPGAGVKAARDSGEIVSGRQCP